MGIYNNLKTMPLLTKQYSKHEIPTHDQFTDTFKKNILFICCLNLLCSNNANI